MRVDLGQPLEAARRGIEVMRPRLQPGDEAARSAGTIQPTISGEAQ